MKNRNIQVRITEITYPLATRNCNEFISCGGILREKNGEKRRVGVNLKGGWKLKDFRAFTIPAQTTFFICLVREGVLIERVIQL